MTSFLVLLVSIFLSRIVNEKANKGLNQEKKAELVDLFSKQRVWRFGFLILVFAVYFASSYYNLLKPEYTYGLYMVFIFVFILYSGLNSFNILRKNNFPDNYIKLYLLSTSITALGLVIFFIVLSGL